MATLPTGLIKFSDINVSFGVASNTQRSLSTCFNYTVGVPATGILSMSTLRGKSRNSVAKLELYPPIALTSASTSISGQTYGNGTYTISSSSQFDATQANWMAFNQSNSSFWSTSVSGAYNSVSPYQYTAGTYSTVINGSSYMGEWLQIQFPVATTIRMYTLYTRTGFMNQGPRDFKIAGSVDGTTWTQVDSQTGHSIYVYS